MNPSVLITGCSSGIGYITALLLKQRGYQVFASARKPKDVERLTKDGLRCVQLDITDLHSIDRALADIYKESAGRLDALINNASYGLIGAVEDISPNIFQQLFATNVFGTHALTQRVIPVMRKQGGGRIITISSALGLASLPYRGVYSASKFAIEALSDAMRVELRGSGIYASLIEPGPIESKFREHAIEHMHGYLDFEHSPHSRAYNCIYSQSLESTSHIPFTKQPEAVVKKIIHALESKRPKPRYYVTLPTHAFALLRRILPARGMDWIMGQISKRER